MKNHTSVESGDVSDESPQEESEANLSSQGGAAGRKRSHEASTDAGDSTEEGGGGNGGGQADLQEFELDPDKRREVRKMRRVMANRRSARESRERRKKLLTDLQESVESLTSENASLTKENLSLRRELASLIEQSGGSASLNMIPNIQGLLQGTQGVSGLSIPPAASLPTNFKPGTSQVDQSRAVKGS